MIRAQASKVLQLITPSTARVTATAAGTVDCIGADYAKFTVSFCSELNTNAVNPTIAIQQSDDTVVTNFSTTGVNAALSPDCTAANNVIVGVDLKSKKRYLRCLLTPGTASNDTIVMAVSCELSRLERAPSNTSDMVGSTNDSVTLVA